MSVVAGDHNIHINDGEKEYKVQRVPVIHPNYKHPKNTRDRKNYDFCILQVESIELDQATTDIVCVPQHDVHVKSISGNRCYVAGWGETSTGGQSPILRSFKADIFSPNHCNNLFGYQFDDDSEFCAGEINGSDACRGDSGGPLVCIDDDNQPILYGIVSWGLGCDIGKPGVYAKVSTVVDWIEEVIGPKQLTISKLILKSGMTFGKRD